MLVMTTCCSRDLLADVFFSFLNIMLSPATPGAAYQQLSLIQPFLGAIKVRDWGGFPSTHHLGVILILVSWCQLPPAGSRCILAWPSPLAFPGRFPRAQPLRLRLRPLLPHAWPPPRRGRPRWRRGQARPAARAAAAQRRPGAP